MDSTFSIKLLRPRPVEEYLYQGGAYLEVYREGSVGLVIKFVKETGNAGVDSSDRATRNATTTKDTNQTTTSQIMPKIKVRESYKTFNPIQLMNGSQGTKEIARHRLRRSPLIMAVSKKITDTPMVLRDISAMADFK